MFWDRLRDYLVVARATFMVALPDLIFNKMRAMIYVLLIIWTLQNSGQNIVHNVQTTVSGIECINNYVRETISDISEQARNAPMAKMREFLMKQDGVFDGAKKVIGGLDSSLTKVMAWKRSMVKRIHDLVENCTEVSQLPFKACVGWLDEKHNGCVDRYSEVICTPIWLFKQMCYATKFLEMHCDWPSRVKDKVKEGVSTFVKVTQQKVTGYLRSTLLYQLFNDTRTLELVINRSKEWEREDIQERQIQGEIRDDFMNLRFVLDICVQSLVIVWIIIALLPFRNAYLYVRSYQEVGIARPVVEDNGLFIEVITAFVSQNFKFFPAIVVIAGDFMIYGLLSKAFAIVHDDGIVIPAPNLYRIQIAGDGFLSDLLSSILKTFQPLTDARGRDQMWTRCFTKPIEPDYLSVVLISLFYLVCVVLTVLQPKIKRLRYFILKYYIPAQEYEEPSEDSDSDESDLTFYVDSSEEEEYDDEEWPSDEEH